MVWMQPQLTDPPMGPTDEIKKLQHRLLLAYGKNSRASEFGVTESGVFDAATDEALRAIQAYIGGAVNASPGVLTYDTKVALGVYVVPTPPSPVCVYFSICGTGVPWNVGYCYDIGQQLDKTKVYHQPIGYPAQAFPMRTSYTAGVAEFINQLTLKGCDKGMPWMAGGYSQGAIVLMIVLNRIFNGDLGRFKDTYRGSIAFGNPMRQAGHTLPGGIDPGGAGIVQPTMTNTPVEHWDFADGKNMVGSPGNDLYATCGVGLNASGLADQQAVWKIVDTGNPWGLAGAVAKLLLVPSFSGTVGAAEAAFYALDFFVVQGISPHLAYGSVQPIAGDTRDCWRVGLDYMNSLVAVEGSK